MNLTFFTLLPFVISVLMSFILTGYLYYTKGSEITSGRLVIWILWTTVLFGLLGFAGSRIDTLPYAFVSVTLGSALLGILYLMLAKATLDWWRRSRLEDVVLLNLTLFFFGLSGFSITYVLLTGANGYVTYLMVGLLGFLLPSLLVKSYDFYMQIPKLRYKTWSYPVYSEVPRLQPIDPIKLMMNFTPVPSEKQAQFESYEVEFPTNESLSDLFHYFISFHNKHREYKKKPIQYLNGEIPLQWVLYTYSLKKKKLYLDMEKTLIENQIGPNQHIYAASSEATS
jgi:hypothetical protein